VEDSLDKFDPYHASQALESFVSDLSTWYIRRSRDRLDNDFFTTLHTVLTDLSIILSPFMPFLPDRMYRNLTGERSVHLATWPTCRNELISPELEEKMSLVRKIVELGHAARKEAAVRVRQPLASILVKGTELSQEYLPLIMEELNLKAVKFETADSLAVELDLELTPELEEEGIARDLMRDIQKARKNAGLTPTDQVVVELPSWPVAWEDEIIAKVNATQLVVGKELKVTNAKKA